MVINPICSPPEVIWPLPLLLGKQKWSPLGVTGVMDSSVTDSDGSRDNSCHKPGARHWASPRPPLENNTGSSWFLIESVNRGGVCFLNPSAFSS
jgi:hypothetical protein